jgi:hypothetical protein
MALTAIFGNDNVLYRSLRFGKGRIREQRSLHKPFVRTSLVPQLLSRTSNLKTAFTGDMGWTSHAISYRCDCDLRSFCSRSACCFWLTITRTRFRHGRGESALSFSRAAERCFSGSATGETFNFQGKTDILIQVEGKKIFIAECKFWKGEKSFLATLDQLLSYLSWRDTKAAVIMFNRNADFSAVLAKIAQMVAAFGREEVGPTSWRGLRTLCEAS